MFYLFLKITIGAALRFFFRRIEVCGGENIPYNKPVIFVSNHPSAFMDPLVIGFVTPKPVYFFARADIFTSKIGNWFMKIAHVSPIYRIVDGVDSLEKNDAIFKHAYNLLSKKKHLLLFGEGFTDEEFIRRVKPLKKGSMRIALGAENKFDFKLGVNIVCVGLNYSDPRKFRSNLVVSFSKPIEVARYKNLFLEHNNKAMIELNREIYSRLKQQVVHIENSENAELLEQLMIVSRRGINNEHSDENIPLKERWEFAKQLADKINNIPSEKTYSLKKTLNEKFGKAGIRKNQNFFSDFAYLTFLFPVFIFGIVNNYPPIKISTFLSRKISKRPVFWSGTDMTFSILTVPVYYFFLIYFLYLISGNILFTLIYASFMPVTGLIAFDYLRKFKSFSKGNRNDFESRRNEIIDEMNGILEWN